jgi:hypothetical protein
MKLRDESRLLFTYDLRGWCGLFVESHIDLNRPFIPRQSQQRIARKHVNRLSPHFLLWRNASFTITITLERELGIINYRHQRQ